jgi:hypothetical protein
MILRTIQTTLFALAAAIFIHPAYCEHPDLSGTWQLDVAASTVGAMPAPQSGVLIISTGSHKMLHMAVTLKDSRTERTTERDMKIDNKYHPVVGDESGEILAKWDGSVLLGKRQTATGPEEIRLVSNPADGSLVETIQSSLGTTTLVWRKR